MASGFNPFTPFGAGARGTSRALGATLPAASQMFDQAIDEDPELQKLLGGVGESFGKSIVGMGTGSKAVDAALPALLKALAPAATKVGGRLAGGMAQEGLAGMGAMLGVRDTPLDAALRRQNLLMTAPMDFRDPQQQAAPAVGGGDKAQAIAEAMKATGADESRAKNPQLWDALSKGLGAGMELGGGGGVGGIASVAATPFKMSLDNLGKVGGMAKGFAGDVMGGVAPGASVAAQKPAELTSAKDFVPNIQMGPNTVGPLGQMVKTPEQKQASLAEALKAPPPLPRGTVQVGDVGTPYQHTRKPQFGAALTEGAPVELAARDVGSGGEYDDFNDILKRKSRYMLRSRY